jgi:transcriptional regulator GlxA family with amidase domain
MKHVSILIPQGDISVSNVEGTHHILAEVNEALVRAGKPALFNVHLVGPRRDSRIKNNLFSIHPDLLLDEDIQSDLVIIPALHGDMKTSLELNRDVIPWIVQQYEGGAEIASLCTGSFLLAATGLLNGKMCATHWYHINEFRKMFPEANLVDDKLMTEQNGIYTSGSAYSYLNLILYLIEKYSDREMAILSAKIFAIEIDRKSQLPFIMFEGQRDHEDEPVKKAQEFIETNFQDKITVDQLAEMLAVSRRGLERRFKKATSNTIVEYIQRVKIEAAKIRLEKSQENVNEVMTRVGYADTKAFRSTFKRLTGLSPMQYRNRYNPEVIV